MQPNVQNKMPAQQPANVYAPQDHHSAEEKMHACVPNNMSPAFPAQQMPANTMAMQDMHAPEKEKKKKKHRIRRMMKRFLILVGILVTFAAVFYAVLVLLETYFPLT